MELTNFGVSTLAEILPILGYRAPAMKISKNHSGKFEVGFEDKTLSEIIRKIHSRAVDRESAIQIATELSKSSSNK